MINRISLSRAVATATAALGACVLACVLQGVFARPASAFSPSTTTGSESTPLDFKTPASSSSATGASGGASIVRTIVGLAIVIAVIWGLAWILRQVKAGREGGREGGRGSHSSAGLANVAALTLGTGRSVHLVRAGNDYVLLGSTEHGVAPIHRYSEHEAREAGLLPADSGALVPEQPAPRSRLLSTASQIVAGTGRVAVHAGLIGQRELPAPGESSSRDGTYRPFDSSARGPVMGRRELPGHSPVVGPRPDPMRMPSPSSGLIERLRELTVRR
jgi:flagellar protein FliO/FliZ